jgi:hypothetical protein
MAFGDSPAPLYDTLRDRVALLRGVYCITLGSHFVTLGKHGKHEQQDSFCVMMFYFGTRRLSPLMIIEYQ